MKKKISIVIASIAILGMMTLNVKSSMNEGNSTGLNLDVLSNTAFANGECNGCWGCIENLSYVCVCDGNHFPGYDYYC